jgi:DnaK suppressor protein
MGVESEFAAGTRVAKGFDEVFPMSLSNRPSDDARRLESVRARLESERLDLLKKLNGDRADDGLADDGRRSDDSLDLLDRESTIRQRETILRRSRQVLHAIERIERGSYGTCVNCSEVIEPRRLENDPSTLLCLACQSADESSDRAPSL